jgi:hypothetical protein
MNAIYEFLANLILLNVIVLTSPLAVLIVLFFLLYLYSSITKNRDNFKVYRKIYIIAFVMYCLALITLSIYLSLVGDYLLVPRPT